MKTYRMMAVAAIVVFLLGVWAAPIAAQQVVVKGRVDVIKDSSGLITSVRIVGRERVYFVVLDENGNDLGAKKENAYVSAVGWLIVEGNQRWLTVSRYAEPHNW
jgi:hypothetical protein